MPTCPPSISAHFISWTMLQCACYTLILNYDHILHLGHLALIEVGLPAVSPRGLAKGVRMTPDDL